MQITSEEQREEAQRLVGLTPEESEAADVALALRIAEQQESAIASMWTMENSMLQEIVETINARRTDRSSGNQETEVQPPE